MGVIFNPFTGEFDFTGTGGGGGDTTIQQYDTDPVSPTPETAWVLRTIVASGGGTPLGLLLGLTYAGIITNSYQLSYRTLEGTTVRVALT